MVVEEEVTIITQLRIIPVDFKAIILVEAPTLVEEVVEADQMGQNPLVKCVDAMGTQLLFATTNSMNRIWVQMEE